MSPRRTVAAVLACVLAVALGAGLLLRGGGDGGGGAPEALPAFGVYAGAGDPDRVHAFERWVGGGARVRMASDFLAGGTWAEVTLESGYPARQWAGSGLRMVFGVPLLPGTVDGRPVLPDGNGALLQAGADGAHDDRFAVLGRRLVEQGQADAVLRLGWEANTAAFAWSYGAPEPGFGVPRKARLYAQAFARAVRALRSAPGQRFTVDWGLLVQDERSVAGDPAAAYPGDDVVDLVGLDLYDAVPADHADWDEERRWQYQLDGRVDGERDGYGLEWQQDFAAAHGKGTSLPEWGLVARLDGGSGDAVDSPGFVRRVHDRVREHPFAYTAYFDTTTGTLDHCLRCPDSRFPRAGDAFRDLFGPALREGPP
ncbi:MAG: uncharacterized protein JWO60_1338 [Frankiales bacterium]|nr:uncharacterized protein [Frankiales bacterium]